MSDIAPIKTLVTIEHINVAGTTQNNAQTTNILSGVANGTLVEGFVVNRNTNNQPILRTQLGDVLLNTELFLKTGTEVTIRVDNAQPNLARIISINGQTPEQFSQIQRAQATRTQSDQLSAPLVSTPGNGQTAIPKPVMLQSVMLQLAARQSLPVQIDDAFFKSLGIDFTAKQPSQPAPTAPLSVILRSISMPAQAAPVPSTPTQNISQASPATNAAPQPLPASALLAAQQIAPLAPAPLPAPQPATPAAPLAPAPVTVPAPASTVGATPSTSPSPIPNLTQAPTLQAEVKTPLPYPLPDTAQPATPRTIPTPTPQAITPHTPQNVPQPLAAYTAPAIAPAATTPLPLTPSQRKPLTAPLSSAPPPPQAPAVQVAPAPKAFSSMEITPQRSLIMQGLVIGQEQQSDTILHTPIGSMRIFTPKPLPAGATVSMEIIPPEQRAVMTQIPASPQTPVDAVETLLREWPELSTLTEDIARSDHALFQATLARVLPTPGKQLTHTMLFFLSALKGGDFKQWAGSRSNELLESKYSDIIRRLGADFTTLQQLFTEPSPQGWVSTSIPLYYENQLQQMRLHIRQDSEQNTSKTTQGGQRFIIDIELSRLGEMQIDGLVHKEANRHQFDMIIRSSKALPSDIENDIRTIYTNAAEVAGFKGALIFQASREHFVNIQTKPRTEGQTGIIA